MPTPIIAGIGAGTSLLSGAVQAGAASSAAKSQEAAAAAGIEEQRRQFDETSGLLRPYVEAGSPALEAQMALTGLRGDEAQSAAISNLERSPQFDALVRQGEEAMLQQAAATGGLRGGNIQGALAQFRPQMLSNLIESQYSRLGGLTNLGQSSAARQAAAGQANAGNIAQLLQQSGQASAGAALARGQAFGSVMSDFAGGVGMYYGLKGGF